MNNKWDGAYTQVCGEEKRSHSAFPSLIAALTVIITAALIFTDVTVGDIMTVSFVAEGVLLMLIFWMMYLSMNENGMRAGREDGGYISKRREYLELTDKFRGEELSSLHRFCSYYKDEELRLSREVFLAGYGISYAVFEKYFLPSAFSIIKRKAIGDGEYEKVYSSLSLRQKNAVRRALRMKPIRLMPEMIMSSRGRRSRSPVPSTIENAQRKRNTFGLVYIALTTLIVVSVAIDIAVFTNAGALVYGLVKILSLVFTGVRGYSAGVLLYTEDATEFYDSMISVLSAYEAWKEKNTHN